MLDRNISRAGHWRVVSRLFGCAAALALMPGFSPAFATDLTEAVSTAITENPTIGQAVENRRATREELNQARGFYLPRIDLDASVGTVMRDNDTTRFYGRDDEWSESHQIGITAQQLLFDGFATDSEVERQTARTDAAAFRVLERTELIGLDVAEAYLDVLRNLEVTGIAAKNIAFQEDTIGTIKRLVQGGVSPRADLQQGQERLESARVLAVDVNRSLEQARNKYRTLVG
ncbi:MAG: TolC family protein, partial [Alphaproteobacteria bacterium]|nr:TolC family protein [Alphaproteobacteria bacterium]